VVTVRNAYPQPIMRVSKTAFFPQPERCYSRNPKATGHLRQRYLRPLGTIASPAESLGVLGAVCPSLWVGDDVVEPGFCVLPHGYL
jgi:hypothetical protein